MSSYSPTHRSVLRLVQDDQASPAVDPASRRREVVRETRAASLRRDLDPSDPRWILAAKTRGSLEGATLSPDRRARLLRLANELGMRPFDANLVIAIVQDEARRPDPADGLADRLRIIPAPRPVAKSTGSGQPIVLAVTSLLFAAVLFTLLVLWLTL